jgi:hypothetical protein
VTRVAVDKQLIKPAEAEIKMPEGVSLISGKAEVELDHLTGRSALWENRGKDPVFFSGLPSDYARRVVWVVRGEGPLQVEVSSERAGTVRLETG